MEKAYRIKINDQFEFDSADLAPLDAVTTGTHQFHIIKNNTTYHAELVEARPQEKAFVLLINGKKYSVTIQDEYDLLVQRLGLSATSVQAVKSIKAPMPGLVLDIQVQAGDTVQKDDSLLILEAMKMENVIKSPGEGVIKSIEVGQGQAVEKNQVLIELE
ncbi:MAG: biotin/lipoyl-containing protein [Bacteroidota bacterium]